MHNHSLSIVSLLSRSQFRVYQSLRKIGFKPAIALEIAFEWFAQN
jgi:hypothetical protein